MKPSVGQENEEQTFTISLWARLNGSISPFSDRLNQIDRRIINVVGASLYQQYAPSEAINDFHPRLADGEPVISSDGRTYTIKLKPGLKFSNGNPLTSEDVLFTYQLYLTPSIGDRDSEVLGRIQTNSSITKIDELTIQFEFIEESIMNFVVLAHPIIEKSDTNVNKYNNCAAGITSDCDWSYSDGEFFVSAGPYMFDSHNLENHRVELIKNPYYQDREVWADRLVFQGKDDILVFEDVIPNFREEILEGISDFIRFSVLDELEKFDEKLLYERKPSRAPWVETIDLNMLHPVFGTGEAIPDGKGAISNNDLIQSNYVRKALSFTMDRDFLVNDLMFGTGIPAASDESQLAIGFNQSLEVDEFSLTLARQYLEYAGFDYNNITDANGDGDYTDEGDTRFFDFTIFISHDLWIRRPFFNHTIPLLAKIGIGLKMDTRPFFQVSQRFWDWPNRNLVPIHDEGGFDAVVFRWIHGQPYDSELKDAERGLCTSEGIARCWNFKNYQNPIVDGLAEEYQSEGTDFEKRAVLLGQIQQILHEDRPSLPLAHINPHHPLKKGVTLPDMS